MKITRASFDAKGERFIGSAHGWEGDRVQIDFVGPSARLFHRVFLPEAQVVMEADDDSITFRRVAAGVMEDRPLLPSVQGPPDDTFRKHLQPVDENQG